MGQLERSDIWYSLVLALMASARRMPLWLSGVHLTFDEGVFLASTDLARSGLAQYQDFFTSQGPLFIPLLQVGHFLSFGDPRGPRTIMVIAAMVATVGTYFILREYAPATRSFWLSLPVALSGTLLLAAGPIQSDGVVLALGLASIALALHTHRSGATVAVGVMMGASVAIKSLHSIPLIVVAFAVLFRRRQMKDFLLAGLSALTVVLVPLLMTDFQLVWDQYVAFHLAKDNTVNILSNLGNVGGFLAEKDLPILVLSLAALVGYVATPRPQHIQRNRTIPVLWLAVTIVIFVGFTSIDGGFVRNIAFFVPPLMALVAVTDRIPLRVLAVLSLLAVPMQLMTSSGLAELSDIESAAVQAMSDVPEARRIVSDDPGLIWSAGRLSHRATVDPSFARFETGYLDAAAVERALMDPTTCLYAATSERFEFGGVEPPGDYLQTAVPGVFLRSTC